MTILLVLGVVLVVFGGLVLLLFPDRPGGKVGWQGLEVSSVDAGLPVIVVGVVAVAVAALHGNGLGFGSNGPKPASASSGSGTPAGCPGSVFKGIPPSRQVRLEVGTNAKMVVHPPEPIRGRVGLRLTDGGKTVGLVVFSYVAPSTLFWLSKIDDADCRPVPLSQLTDASRQGQNPYKPQSDDAVQMRLGRKLYSLTLSNDASASALEATFTGGTS